MPDPSHDLFAMRPDPLEPEPEQVERYVRRLQELASSEPQLARREAWEQIRLAGARAGRRRQETGESLDRIFCASGPPSEALEGPYRGRLVTPATFAALDPLFRGLAALWMPWIGKRFDARAGCGDNLLEASARWPAKLFWPGYELTPTDGGHYAAFRFRTYVDAGKLDPDVRMLKIDYDSDENPDLLIRDTLDELVEVVPGAYLGKMLLRTGGADSARWHLVAYFALEPAAREPVREQPRSAVVQAPSPA